MIIVDFILYVPLARWWTWKQLAPLCWCPPSRRLLFWRANLPSLHNGINWFSLGCPVWFRWRDVCSSFFVSCKKKMQRLPQGFWLIVAVLTTAAAYHKRSTALAAYHAKATHSYKSNTRSCTKLVGAIPFHRLNGFMSVSPCTTWKMCCNNPCQDFSTKFVCSFAGSTEW